MTMGGEHDFAAAAAVDGVLIKHVQADGQIHRVPVADKRGRGRDGAYQFFVSGDGGWFQNFCTQPEPVFWFSKSAANLSSAERSQRHAAMQSMRREAANAREVQYADAALAAAALFDAATPIIATPDHPYLAAKQVGAHGVRMDDQGFLLIPGRDAAGVFQTLQRISGAGVKRFMSGARLTGAMHIIGAYENPENILIAEGYSTAATLHEDTGHMTVAAFCAGNLAAVAKAMRFKYPTARIIICGDDDAKEGEDGNSGHVSATAAAREVDCVAVFPDFQCTLAKKTEEKLSDFNDLHVKHGAAAVARIVGVRRVQEAAAEIKSFSNPKFAQSKVKDKCGPVNLDAERIVLASFLAQNRAYEEYADSVAVDDFHDALHRQIYNAIAELVAMGKRAEPASIQPQLTAPASVPNMSIGAYVRGLDKYIRHSDEIPTFAGAVRGAAQARRVGALCAKYSALADAGAPDIADRMTADLSTIAGSITPETYGYIAARVPTVMAEIHARRERGGGLSGIRTGFSKIDAMLDGLCNSRLYVIGARPKQGKTALALCMMRNIIKQGKVVMFFSLEMPRDEIIKRLISLESDVEYLKIARGELTEEEAERVENAAYEVTQWPLIIDDATRLTSEALAIRARRAVRVENAHVIFIDYLQLLSGAGKGLYEQITSVSKSVADMRKTLDRPIVALAQLNRKLVGRATGDIDLAHFSPEMTRPNDADVRDSGQVEQSADVLMFLNRPIVYLENLKPTGPDDVDWQGAVTKWRNRAELIVHMNRSGPRGIVDAMFREGTMGFSPV